MIFKQSLEREQAPEEEDFRSLVSHFVYFQVSDVLLPLTKQLLDAPQMILLYLHLI